jgi:hypothetical protein
VPARVTEGVERPLTQGSTSLKRSYESRTIRPVGVVKNNVGPADDLREFADVKQLRRRDSDFSNEFKLAYRALVLVSRGASEREAVQQATASDPRLTSVKREALALVLGTVGEQDVIDVLVRNAHPEERWG